MQLINFSFLLLIILDLSSYIKFGKYLTLPIAFSRAYWTSTLEYFLIFKSLTLYIYHSKNINNQLFFVKFNNYINVMHYISNNKLLSTYKPYKYIYYFYC